MLSRTFIKVGFLGAALLLSACGQDFAAVTESRLASKSLEVSEAVQEAEASMAQVEVAMAEIDMQSIDDVLAEVDGRTDGANVFNLKSRLNDIKDILENQLAPIIGSFGGVGTDLEGLREEILLHMSSLDPSVAADASTIAKLEELLGKLDGLQDSLTGSAAGLVSQLDFIDEMLDKVVDKIVGAIGIFNPLSFIIKPILNTVKDMIVNKIKQPLVDMITKGFGAVGDIGGLI